MNALKETYTEKSVNLNLMVLWKKNAYGTKCGGLSRL